jgi:hypothetical protein
LVFHIADPTQPSEVGTAFVLVLPPDLVGRDAR